MAHIGKKEALGFVGFERRLGRPLKVRLRRLEGLLCRLASVDIAPRANHLDGVPSLVADEMLLVADPAIRAILLAEAIFRQVLAGPEQLDLLRFDLREVIGMHMATPKIRIFEIFIRGVSQHLPNAGAHESGREISAGDETVDNNRGGAQQQVEPLARALLGLLCLLACRDVRPRADDLDWLSLRVAHNVLLVVHPEIGAIRAADAILDRALVALEHLINPSTNAGDIVRVHAIAPKIGVVEIFSRATAKQSGDALAHEGGLEIAARHSAVDHRRRGVEQTRHMGMRRGLHVGNTLETFFFLFTNLPLMRSFELGQHLIKCNREAPDLVLAAVVNTVAIILCPANCPGEPFELRERPHNVVMSQKSEEDTQDRKRSR